MRSEPYGYTPIEVSDSMQGQKDYEPYLSEPQPELNLPYQLPKEDQSNYTGTASDVDSEPSMHNEHGHTVTKSIPEWQYNVEDSQFDETTVDKSMPQKLANASNKYHNPEGQPYAVVKDISKKPDIHIHLELPELNTGEADLDPIEETEPNLMQYVYQGHDEGDICADFNGKTFDLNNRTGRPIPPSEGLGYTNTHPNCQCYWNPVTDNFEESDISDNQRGHLSTVNRKVAQRARRGTLHTVKPDGTLSQRTRKTNPIHEIKRHALVREALIDLKQEFKWLTQRYQDAVRNIPMEGKWYIVRAAAETVTDHRAEGEKYKRLLAGDELHAMARTAIGKDVDINHNPEWRTDSHVYDSEYDMNRKEIQMLVHVKDPEIITGIDNGSIKAVSINGGAPRSEEISCNQTECFQVPRGVVLGELDNIAFTWVVTAPQGLWWQGKMIPHAEPGIKSTKIQEL
jgi:hypothetical protein